ncbi:MAG: hypothetical protein ABSC17_04270 [Thermacetogeniaceae bacterium]
MKISKRGWLILGLCAALVVSLAFNGWQALQGKIARGDTMTALGSTVNFALAGLDSGVYMTANQADWKDSNFRLGFYKNLLQADEGSAAASQLAGLTSGDASAVAGRLGDLAARLDSTYLPAAQRLANGQASDVDRSLLVNFCDSVRQSGWPLKAQLRDQGWTKLRGSLDSLASILGPVSQRSQVFNVPDYPADQPSDTSNQTVPTTQSPSPTQPATSGISIQIGPASGA